MRALRRVERYKVCNRSSFIVIGATARRGYSMVSTRRSLRQGFDLNRIVLCIIVSMSILARLNKTGNNMKTEDL